MKYLTKVLQILLALSIFALVLWGVWYCYLYYTFKLGIYGTAAYSWGVMLSWWQSFTSFISALFQG